MNIEELEKQIRNKFLNKYSSHELENKKDFFTLSLVSRYKRKEITFFNLVEKNKPQITIIDTNYQKCFLSLLEVI